MISIHFTVYSVCTCGVESGDMDVWVYEITTRRCRLHSLFLRMHISPSIWSPLTTVRGVSIMNRSCFQWVRLCCNRKEIKMRGGRCVRKEKRPIGRLTIDRNTHTHTHGASGPVERVTVSYSYWGGMSPKLTSNHDPKPWNSPVKYQHRTEHCMSLHHHTGFKLYYLLLFTRYPDKGHLN